LTPAPIDAQVPFPFGLGGSRPERGVDRVVAQTAEIVAARRTDVVGAQLDAQLHKQWRERMERQRKSGLSIAEFCRKEGVSSVTFHTWKRKLQGESSDRSSTAGDFTDRQGVTRSKAIPPRRRPHRAQAAAATETAGSANFVQVRVVGARSAMWIELALVDGTIVRIPEQNLAALQTVFPVCWTRLWPANRCCRG